MLAELEDELALASKRRGVTLEWSAAERSILALISATIDRKSGLARAYSRCGDDIKLRVKLSAEIRQLENQQTRLIKLVNPDVPVRAPVSFTTQRAQKAANARWDRERDHA